VETVESKDNRDRLEIKDQLEPLDSQANKGQKVRLVKWDQLVSRVSWVRREWQEAQGILDTLEQLVSLVSRVHLVPQVSVVLWVNRGHVVLPVNLALLVQLVKSEQLDPVGLRDQLVSVDKRVLLDCLATLAAQDQQDRLVQPASLDPPVRRVFLDPLVTLDTQGYRVSRDILVLLVLPERPVQLVFRDLRVHRGRWDSRASVVTPDHLVIPGPQETLDPVDSLVLLELLVHEE
jgi:hypothetical protein